MVQQEGRDPGKQAFARGVVAYMQSFDFVFILQLMLTILGFTHSLSLALQRKDQDILNAMALVKVTKRQLQMVRENGWNTLLDKISSFCGKHNIEMLDMGEPYIDPKAPRKKTNVTNDHHYRVELFLTIMDRQLLELDDRFNEMNSELLSCVACLSPCDSFRDFDKSKLQRLVEFYPNDFSHNDRMAFDFQFNIYIDDVRSDDRFANLKELGELSEMLVLTKKHLSHNLVYRLLKLALILPVSTATVERCFSAMNSVKSYLRNSSSDQLMNDCLICCVEKDVLDSISTKDVMNRFQKMKTRRGQL